MSEAGREQIQLGFIGESPSLSFSSRPGVNEHAASLSSLYSAPCLESISTLKLESGPTRNSRPRGWTKLDPPQFALISSGRLRIYVRLGNDLCGNRRSEPIRRGLNSLSVFFFFLSLFLPPPTFAMSEATDNPFEPLKLVHFIKEGGNSRWVCYPKDHGGRPASDFRSCVVSPSLSRYPDVENA